MCRTPFVCSCVHRSCVVLHHALTERAKIVHHTAATADGYLSIDYTNLVPTLIEAIKELRHTVKRLCNEAKESNEQPS